MRHKLVSFIALMMLYLISGCNSDSVLNVKYETTKDGNESTATLVVRVLRGGYLDEIPEVMARVYLINPNNKMSDPVVTDEMGYAQGILDCDLPGYYQVNVWSSDWQRFGFVIFYFDGTPNQTINVTVYTLGV